MTPQIVTIVMLSVLVKSATRALPTPNQTMHLVPKSNESSIDWKQTAVVTEVRSSTTSKLFTQDSIVRGQSRPYIAASVLKNCTLIPETTKITSKIRQGLGAKMIEYHLNIENCTRLSNMLNHSKLYKPFFWVRSTGRHGTGLLLLRPEFDALSLSTLGLGVEKMEVTLVEEPRHCLSGLSSDDVELLIRELIMNDFQNTSSSQIVQLQPTDSVCNMHVVNIKGRAEFRYLCCQRSASLHITCKYLESDTWLSVLLVAITLLKIVVVLFSPRLIPGSLYRAKHVAKPYIHNIQKDKPFTLTAVVSRHLDRFNAKSILRLSKFAHMKKFKKTIQQMKPGIIHELKMNKLQLRVKSRRLLPEDYAPVGLFETLYESLFRCKIRERPSVKECCDANFFVRLKCGNRSLSWYSVLKDAMQAVLVIVLATPWIIRVVFYFRYEHDETHMRKEAANERSLSFSFPGNLTLFLTPLHILFLVIYVTLSMESCIYGVISKKTKERFKFVLRKCFQDMREINKVAVLGWIVKTSVRPCTRFGAIGVGIGLLTWTVSLPVFVPVLAFYICPTLNVTVRLLAHFVVYLVPKDTCSRFAPCVRLEWLLANIEKDLEMNKITEKEKLLKRHDVLDSKRKRIQQLFVILLCLISMYSIIFLMTEFVSFVVEVFVYTLIGLIVNASTTYTYISLAFLLGVYGIDCFGYVKKKFLSFNKTIHKYVLSLGKEQVENDIYRADNIPCNVAFRVKTERAEVIQNPICLTANIDGFPRWEVSRLVLFLTEKDQPMIPRGFFFDCCKLPYYSVPGELLLNYIRAAAEFFMIILFLIFVLVVVLAFGDTYHISATNRMLATIAGGFLPFMLRNIVFQSHTVSQVDVSNTQFQVCLHNLLDKYRQTWPIYDIDIEGSPTRIESPLPHYENTSKTEIDVMKRDHNLQPVILKPDIDLLIHVPNKIDQDEFPGLSADRKSRVYNGSASFLDDFQTYY